MDKFKKNWLIFLAIIVLVISGIVYVYLANQEKASIDTGFVSGKIAYDKIDKYVDGIMLATKNKETLIIDLNDKVIEKIPKEASDVEVLYGGYYRYTLASKVYLNRNGKNIKTFDTLFQEEFNLYKDENDENAVYITLNALKLSKDIYYVTISNDSTIKTIIYNIKTGKKLYQTDNYISLLKTPDTKEYEYFVVGGKELVRISDFKTIFKETDISIAGDNNRLDVSDDIITNSSKYIVISNVNAIDGTFRYGLIDFEGNILIPISYEDLSFKTDSSRYIAAKKDGKYGLINSLNEELLPFSYDALEVYDKNVVAVKDKRLVVLDNELKEIYNHKKTLLDKLYDSRICCGNTNSFEAFMTENNLVINIYPNQEEDNLNNTLIINRQNDVKEIKGQSLKYITDKNNIIKTNYLIEEQIDDKTLSLNIYDVDGEALATYETFVQETINSISYDLINEKYLLINIYNAEYKVLYKAIIETKTGKVMAEGDETVNYIKKQPLKDGYYYTGKNNSITIKNENDDKVTTIIGSDVIYLNNNYYAVKNSNGKYYICRIILNEKDVK